MFLDFRPLLCTYVLSLLSNRRTTNALWWWWWWWWWWWIQHIIAQMLSIGREGSEMGSTKPGALYTGYVSVSCHIKCYTRRNTNKRGCRRSSHWCNTAVRRCYRWCWWYSGLWIKTSCFPCRILLIDWCRCGCSSGSSSSSSSSCCCCRQHVMSACEDCAKCYHTTWNKLSHYLATTESM